MTPRGMPAAHSRRESHRWGPSIRHIGNRAGARNPICSTTPSIRHGTRLTQQTKANERGDTCDAPVPFQASSRCTRWRSCSTSWGGSGTRGSLSGRSAPRGLSGHWARSDEKSKTRQQGTEEELQSMDHERVGHKRVGHKRVGHHAFLD